MAASQPSREPHFLRLPIELRDMIYDHIFDNSICLSIRIDAEGELQPYKAKRPQGSRRQIIPILSACKQIHAEAIKRFYANSSFFVNAAPHFHGQHLAFDANFVHFDIRSDILASIKRIDMLCISVGRDDSLFERFWYGERDEDERTRTDLLKLIDTLRTATGTMIVESKMVVCLEDLRFGDRDETCIEAFSALKCTGEVEVRAWIMPGVDEFEGISRKAWKIIDTVFVGGESTRERKDGAFHAPTIWKIVPRQTQR